MSKVEPYFDEIVALVASGLSINAALRSRPEFPVKATWKCYAYDNRFPERRQRLNEAQAAGKVIQAEAGYAPQHYSEDQYERSLAIIRDNFPTNMQLLTFDGCPGYVSLWRRAKADPEFSERFVDAKAGRVWGGGRAPTYTDAEYDRALTLIKSSGHAAYRERSSADGMPHYSMLVRRGHKDPAFGRRYASATMIQHISAREMLKSSLLSNDLYARVNRGVSRIVDPDSREDIISDLIAAVLAGDVTEEEIEIRCAEYVARHNRTFSRHRFASLDAPIFDDRAFNMLDRLTTDPSHSWGI